MWGGGPRAQQWQRGYGVNEVAALRKVSEEEGGGVSTLAARFSLHCCGVMKRGDGVGRSWLSETQGVGAPSHSAPLAARSLRAYEQRVASSRVFSVLFVCEYVCTSKCCAALLLVSTLTRAGSEECGPGKGGTTRSWCGHAPDSDMERAPPSSLCGCRTAFVRQHAHFDGELGENRQVVFRRRMGKWRASKA